MTKVIETDKAPKAVGPYSQAVDAGDLIFISGQIGLDPETQQFVADSVEEQTKQVMRNIGAILEEAGKEYTDIVKMGIFLDSMDDFQTVNEIYAGFLSEPYPARAAIEAAKLPKGAKVEMEAIVKK
ncbi:MULTISPECIES: RidA family protein [Salimicrobium]|uniref:RutC family protein YabJ n=4 Tax=Salimicrobium TaxID=351195 RepID=K2FNH9_9BACI|nr:MULTISPECIES: RidA family protein [Salimicrobium]AKG05152.1 RutC protein [Salimicrobium jeotgali]EKE32476.1 RutC family protein YabJ [Salimicrobium jeotgali]MBM7695542.1 2-iminobutanoate/2-iminopropanoate deaminase [Salimicrobium jeotgali]PBB05122.1 RidA family protein [Salimicrobium humidisoli]SDY13980.1 2-iminobutanoate/2-iminopropanoate deaminase [Salimicrobium album]